MNTTHDTLIDATLELDAAREQQQAFMRSPAARSDWAPNRSTANAVSARRSQMSHRWYIELIAAGVVVKTSNGDELDLDAEAQSNPSFVAAVIAGAK
jgi:hypothetical protein